MYREERSIQHVDLITLGCFILLVILGWAMVFAVSYTEGSGRVFNLDEQHGKQLLWIGTAVLIGISILIIDRQFFPTLAYPIYGFVILLLIVAYFLAPEVKGARAWFEIGFIRIQPSEFAKFATALALARYLSSLNISIKQSRTRLMALGMIFLPM